MPKLHPRHRQECVYIAQAFAEIAPSLDERRLRLWCAVRARSYNRLYGHGGIAVVHQATGVSRSRIATGIRDLSTAAPVVAGKRPLRGIRVFWTR